jgi:abortive infection bacteriophage resistance protein
MYKILKKDYKIEISKNYKVDYKDFSNWITLVKKIRNIVAHHERLWNNEYNMWLSSNDKIF